jgi:hypothetical protein
VSLYEISGSINGDGIQTTTVTNLGLIAPSNSALGAGPYYGKKQSEDISFNGVPIGPGGGASKYDVSYYQFDNNQLGLVGKDFFELVGAFDLVKSESYSPVFYDTRWTMQVGQTVNKNTTVTTLNGSVVNSQAQLTQRTEFVAIENIVLNGRNYSACKYTVSRATPSGGELTTSWYLNGKGLLLQKLDQIVDSAGIVTPKLRTTLVRTTVDAATVFPLAN